MVAEDVNSIIKRHARYLKSNLGIVDMPEDFPFLYWIPKMHKKPFSKQRYIAASYSCTTKPLSQLLTKVLKLVEKEHRKICHRYEKNYGIDPMWIIHNSKSFHRKAAKENRKRQARNVQTYDFSTLSPPFHTKSSSRNSPGSSRKRSKARNINSLVCTDPMLAGPILLVTRHRNWTVQRLYAC